MTGTTPPQTLTLDNDLRVVIISRTEGHVGEQTSARIPDASGGVPGPVGPAGTDGAEGAERVAEPVALRRFAIDPAIAPSLVTAWAWDAPGRLARIARAS